MGDSKSRGGFPAEVSGLRSSDYDRAPYRGEKYERFEEKGLKRAPEYVIMVNRDT